jgi:hypothetical protein
MRRLRVSRYDGESRVLPVMMNNLGLLCLAFDQESDNIKSCIFQETIGICENACGGIKNVVLVLVLALTNHMTLNIT